MAATTPNIAKGRVAELGRRVNANDPANCAFVLVPLVSTATLATLEDLDTLDAILRDADTAEHSTIARIVIDDGGGITVTVDDRLDRQLVDVPDQTWPAATGEDVTHAVICWDPDTTAGDDTALVPCGIYEGAIALNGGDITVRFGADGIFVARE